MSNSHFQGIIFEVRKFGHDEGLAAIRGNFQKAYVCHKIKQRICLLKAWLLFLFCLLLIIGTVYMFCLTIEI